MNTTTKKNLGAITAGLLAIVIVRTVIDLVLDLLGVYPPTGQPMSSALALIATAGRLFISVVGALSHTRLAHTLEVAPITDSNSAILGQVAGYRTKNKNDKMKNYIAITLLATVAATSATAGEPTIKPDGEKSSEERTNMKSVSLGEHFKLTVKPSARIQIQKFFGEVLGCQVTKKPKVDFIRFENNFSIGVIYDEAALSEASVRKSIWMELRTDKPLELKQKILDFGIEELDYWDKEHFYFQAPGGQVFRLAGGTENMTKGEK